MPIQPDAIYAMNKAYVEFAGLHNMLIAGAFFIPWKGVIEQFSY